MKRLFKWSTMIGGCLALYVASYSILSASGGWVVSESGELRPLAASLAMSDILIWQPRYGYCQWYHSVDGSECLRAWGFLGHFYAPLILFDQAYVHRTIYYIRPDGNFIESFPPYDEYHPTQANRFLDRFPYKEVSRN